MFPEFLKEFEEGLQQYKVDCIEIIATPLGDNETAGIRQSKFAGIPYLPTGVAYPKDLKGSPMLFIAQINFKEVPHLEDHPEKGILQFFVSADWKNVGFDEVNDAKQTKILFHENLQTEHQNDFSFLTGELTSQSPFTCEHTLAFTKKTEFGGISDFRFDFLFNGVDWLEYCEQLDEDEEAEFDAFLDTEGHKIGGYSFFAQSDPREGFEERENDISLLQIDSDDHIVIGDVGVIHFFVNREDLKNRNFEKVHFHWDCL